MLESSKNPKSAKMLVEQGMFNEMLVGEAEGEKKGNEGSAVLQKFKSAADLGRSLDHNIIRDGRLPII